MENKRDIDQYAKDYLNNYGFEGILVKYRRKKVLDTMNHYKSKRILEIGCGADSISNYYTNFDKWVIVEPSKEFLKTAVKDKHNSNIEIYSDFFENIIDVLSNKNFDFVILSALLHEVPDPKLFLQKIMGGVMNNNTILHIDVPNCKSFHLLWAYESGLIKQIGGLTDRAKQLQQNSTFDLESLEKLANNFNLAVLDKGSYFIKPFNHSKMEQCIQNNLIDQKLLDGLDAMIKYMPQLGCEIFVDCKKK